MSEEDGSDSEIVLLDTKQPKCTPEQQLLLRSQVGIIDTQLKALGLYEEGLSYEQKEELLAVVAASRETAEQEASMRLRAHEWQQKVIVDDADLGAKTAKLSITSSPPSLVDACTSTIKSDKSSAEAISSLGCTPSFSCSSQNLHENVDNEKVSMTATGMKICSETGECAWNEIGTEKWVHPMTNEFAQKAAWVRSLNQTTKRGRRRRPKSQTVMTNESHADSPAVEIMDTKDDFLLQENLLQQRKELDKAIPVWQPCGSPNAPMMECDRFSCQKLTNVCSDSSEHVEKLLHSIEEFHSAVDKLQRNSGVYAVWGQPITVGRAYATRSTRSRGPDSENSDGIGCQSPAASDPPTKESMCASYLRLRMYSRSLGSSTTNNMPTSKAYKNLCLLSRKSSLLAAKANASLKKSSSLGKQETAQSVDSTALSTVAQNVNVLGDKFLKTENLPPPSLGVKENQDVSFSDASMEISPRGHRLQDQNATFESKTDVHKKLRSRFFTKQQNSCISRLIQDSQSIESQENQRPFLRAFQDKPGQESSTEASKRKGVSSNIKPFPSPAKRLKGAGPG